VSSARARTTRDAPRTTRDAPHSVVSGTPVTGHWPCTLNFSVFLKKLEYPVYSV